MFGSAMGLPKTPRTVSVGNCHLAVFLLGFAAAIWHSEALQPVSIGLRNCHPACFQQPFKPLKPPSSFAMGLPRPHELFLLETAIWQCFCWASKLLSGICDALQPVSIGLRNCHPALFQQPLKLLKPSQQLCHGTFRGPTTCFCWKLPSGSVSVGFEAAIWHFRGATTCFYWASKLPSGTFPAALKTLPAALPWDMSTNGVQHRLARGRGKENSAKRRRVNLTFPIPGASIEKHHISKFCFSAAGGNSLVSLTYPINGYWQANDLLMATVTPAGNLDQHRHFAAPRVK